MIVGCHLWTTLGDESDLSIAEKALVNLPSPLTVSDELCVHKTGFNEVIKLTAGVHRQTWVSGIAMFVDVHISNRSSKMVKKIELHLERVTTFYDHTAASTDVEVASRLRLPDRNEKEVVSKSIIKKRRHRWQGVPAQSHYMSTCAVHVPMDLVSIDLGMLLVRQQESNSKSFYNVWPQSSLYLQFDLASQALPCGLEHYLRFISFTHRLGQVIISES